MTSRPTRAARHRPSTILWSILVLSFPAILLHTSSRTKSFIPPDDYVHKSATGSPPKRRHSSQPSRPVVSEKEVVPQQQLPQNTSSSSSLECLSASLWDSNGKPCTDLKKAFKGSAVYYLNESHTQYLACTIPKNGCSYHLGLMNRISGMQSYESMNLIHDKDRKTQLALYEQDSSTIAHLLSNSSVPKYIVVRNPLRRTLSGYLDKVYKLLPEENRTVSAFHRWVYEQFPPNAPLPDGGKGLNPHWRPQVSFCGFQHRDISKHFRMFRVEQPGEYVDFLYSFVPSRFLDDGWRGKEDLSLRDHVLGPRKRTTNTGSKFETFFNRLDIFDHLATVLKEDIELLGYTKEVAEMREQLLKRVETQR